jgi:hypothetical protein
MVARWRFQSASRFADLAKGSLQDVALEVRDMYTAAVHHHAMVDAEARKGVLESRVTGFGVFRH